LITTCKLYLGEVCPFFRCIKSVTASWVKFKDL